MISCQNFRTNWRPGIDDADLLAHFRSCDACLDYAVRVDPDSFFRAIGGEELTPPGGVDAFTADVMAQIRLRQAEGSMEARRFLISPRRLAAAAVITATIGVAALIYDREQKPLPAVHQAVMAVAARQLATKPIVETYDSKNATIVEVASEGINDTKVVMIFDESLPADL
jgi:hypothetical protein